MPERLTVMLVDDNPDDRALVGRALSGAFADLEVLEVRNPMDLQRVVDENQVDLAILDYALGWSTGIEVLDRVRESWPRCATIMFTDTGSEEVAVEALKRGLDDYLVKSTDRLDVLITAIRRALDERERRETVARLEAELRGLFDRLPAAIYRSSPAGTLLYANPALLDLLGYESMDELSAQPTERLYVDPGDRERWFGSIQEEGDVVDGELRLQKRDGEVIWVRDRGRAVRLEPGGPLVVEGLLDDITDRKRAEAALERQTAFLQLLQVVTAAANEAPVLSDALRTALEEICRRLGWPVGHVFLPSDDDAEVLEPSGIWHSESPRRFKAFAVATRDTVFRRGEGLPGRVYATGEPEWMEALGDGKAFARARAAADAGLVSGLAVPVTAGSEVAAVVEFFSDESRPRDSALLNVLLQAGTQLGRVAERERAENERRRIESHALQARKMEAVGRLAGGVAHDFNNLLTVIMLESEDALTLTESDAVRDAVDQIRSAGDRAGALVRQLLTFSRQGEPGSIQVFDLNDVVEAALRMLERLLDEDVTIEAHLDDGLHAVRAAPGEFEQVLVNLVVNASDAMPHGGTVSIETQNVELDAHLTGGDPPTGRGVMLAVSDTGVGIPPELQERVFEPFFTTKEAEKGTGLGLATAYGIVQKAGGVMRVYSEEGEGTTFRIFLPAADDDAVVETIEEREVPRGSEKVLLVEDEERVRDVTARALRGQGFEVIEATDGAGALEILRERGTEVDLLLTDVGMPGMRGPELAERAAAWYPQLPILLTSGYGRRIVEDADPQAFRHLTFIPKPYSLPDLIRRVRAALDAAVDPSEGED